MTVSRTGTTRLYVVGNVRGLALGGKKWHVAAHEPAGYGIRTLCGVSWGEGKFRTHGPGVAPPLCLRCASISGSRSRA